MLRLANSSVIAPVNRLGGCGDVGTWITRYPLHPFTGCCIGVVSAAVQGAR